MQTIWILDQLNEGFILAFEFSWIIILLVFISFVMVLLNIVRAKMELAIAFGLLPLALIAIFTTAYLSPWAIGAMIIIGGLILFGAVLEIIGKNP